MERGTRIELVTLAWKARVIPFYEPRMVRVEGFEPSVSCSQSRRIEPDFPTLGSMATSHRFELRRSVLETDMLPLTSRGNMEVGVRFELTIVEICSHLPWSTRPPNRNKLITKMY